MEQTEIVAAIYGICFAEKLPQVLKMMINLSMGLADFPGT